MKILIDSNITNYFSKDGNGVPFIISGRDYIVRATGDFGGGFLKIGYVEQDSLEEQELTTLSAGGGFLMESPTDIIFVTSVGTSSPSIIFGIEYKRR